MPVANRRSYGSNKRPANTCIGGLEVQSRFRISSAHALGEIFVRIETAGGETINVVDNDFEHVVVQSRVPVLVDFWAPWCKPCLAIDPVMKQLASEYSGRAKIVKVNIDEAVETAERFGVRGIPNVMLFTNGERQMNTGAQPKSTYSGMIDGALKESESRATENPDGQLDELLKSNDFRMGFISSGELDDVKGALARNPEIGRQPFDDGTTPMALVLRQSFKDRINVILSCNPSLTVSELAGVGRLDALIKAVDENLTTLDEADANGTRPLDLAVRHNQYECCKFLLERGADPSLLSENEGNSQWSPIATAVSSSNDEIAKLLIDHGADLSVTNRHGLTLLHLAALAGFASSEAASSNMIEVLLENGVDKAAVDDNGDTALEATQKRVERWMEDDSLTTESKKAIAALVEEITLLLA